MKKCGVIGCQELVMPVRKRGKSQVFECGGGGRTQIFPFKPGGKYCGFHEKGETQTSTSRYWLPKKKPPTR